MLYISAATISVIQLRTQLRKLSGLTGLLPRQVCPGKVAIVAGVRKNRLVQLQGMDHTCGREVKETADRLFQQFVRVCTGEVGIHVDGHRIGPPDCIGQSDCAFLREAGGHNILGDAAGHVGAAAVHLGPILAGQRAAAVGGQPSIGVHHQFAAGQAGVRLDPTQYKAAGGIDENLRVLIRGEDAEGWLDDEFQQFLPQLGQILILRMLAGEDDGGDPPGCAEDILHRHLRLSVR